jgi:hypothetical protein
MNIITIHITLSAALIFLSVTAMFTGALLAISVSGLVKWWTGK